MPRQLLTRGRMKITTNERVSIVPQTAENIFQLKLEPVVKDDGGEYRCIFKQDTGVEYRIVVLNVQGEFFLYLNCATSGQGKPEIMSIIHLRP